MFNNIFLFLFFHLAVNFSFRSHFSSNSVDVASLLSVILCYEKNFNIKKYLFINNKENLFIIQSVFMQNVVSLIFEVKNIS